MRTHRPFRFFRRLGLGLAAVLWLGTGVAAIPGTVPKLQSLVRPGRWPQWPRGTSRDVKVVDNYAYVANGPSGLAVFDVSLPTKPLQVGTCATKADARGLAVSGSYAYVMEGEAGFEVIDVSNPSRCRRVGGASTTWGAFFDVAVSGNHAYVADASPGLQVFDVSDCQPSARRRL